MLLSKAHPFSGEINSREVPITQEQLEAWQNGELIQRAAPQLSADDREFLISGLVPGEYDELFPEED